MEQKRQEAIEGLKIVEQAALGLKEEGMPYISVEAVLKFAQDALAVLTAEQERSSAPVGKIETDECLYIHDAGDGKTETGKKYKKRAMLFTYTPYVQYKDKRFTLTWDDIVTLAERAGLFNDEVAE